MSEAFVANIWLSSTMLAFGFYGNGTRMSIMGSQNHNYIFYGPTIYFKIKEFEKTK
jgi:hypothetical protein